jgi:hypothetical protein
MGYKDQKVIRDSRDANAAAMIGAVGGQFQKSIKEGSERREERKKEEEEKANKKKKDQIAAQQSVAGRYKQAADYKRTGNKGLDLQVIELIEKAAVDEAAAYAKAFGSDGDPNLAADYQKLKALNDANLNDLTVFIGTFDADVDAAAAAIANGEELLPGSGDFGYELDIQSGNYIPKIKVDPNTGRYTLVPQAQTTGGADPYSANAPINLGDYHNNIKNNGTRFETINTDYNLVMDAWSKPYIESGDEYYKQNQNMSGGTPTGGGQTTGTVSKSGDVEVAGDYKARIIDQLKNSTGKNGKISASVKGGPGLSNEQIFYQIRDNIQIPGAPAAGGAAATPAQDVSGMTYDEFITAGGNNDVLYAGFADQVIDRGAYKRGGIKNVKVKGLSTTNPGAITDAQVTQ